MEAPIGTGPGSRISELSSPSAILPTAGEDVIEVGDNVIIHYDRGVSPSFILNPTPADCVVDEALLLKLLGSRLQMDDEQIRTGIYHRPAT